MNFYAYASDLNTQSAKPINDFAVGEGFCKFAVNKSVAVCIYPISNI